MEKVLAVGPDADLTYPDFEVLQGERITKTRIPVKVQKLSGLVRYLLKGDADTTYKEFRFIYPNVSLPLNRFGRFEFASVLVHLPYSETETLVEATNWRNFLRATPLLTRWFDRETAKTGLQILVEDNSVVKDQLPRIVRYRGSREVLVKSDAMVLDSARSCVAFWSPIQSAVQRIKADSDSRVACSAIGSC